MSDERLSAAADRATPRRAAPRRSRMVGRTQRLSPCCFHPASVCYRAAWNAFAV